MQKALALNEMERSEIEVAWLVQRQDSHAKGASPQRDGHGLFKGKIAMRKALALNEMERSEIEVAWLVQSQDSHAKAPALNEMERSESGGGLQPGCHRCTRHHGQTSHGCYKGFCGHKSFLKNRVAPQDGMACSKPKWPCKSASPQRDGVLTRIPPQVLAGYRLENN